MQLFRLGSAPVALVLAICGCSGSPKMPRRDLPVAQDLPLAGLSASTSWSANVAISAGGVVYVVWPSRGQQKGKAPGHSGVPFLPDEDAFPDVITGSSLVPGLQVFRDGKW